MAPVGRPKKTWQDIRTILTRLVVEEMAPVGRPKKTWQDIRTILSWWWSLEEMAPVGRPKKTWQDIRRLTYTDDRVNWRATGPCMENNKTKMIHLHLGLSPSLLHTQHCQHPPLNQSLHPHSTLPYKLSSLIISCISFDPLSDHNADKKGPILSSNINIISQHQAKSTKLFGTHLAGPRITVYNLLTKLPVSESSTIFLY